MYILNEGYERENIFFHKGKGPFIFSKKKYLDLTSGGGCLILGHNNKILRDSIKKFLKLNISNFAQPNEYAVDLSNTLKKIYPQFKKFIFCNSGAEANIKALRICRAITNKKKIVNVSGSWHGSVDQFLFTSNKKNKPIPISDGVNDNKKNLIYIPYNNIKSSLSILKKNKKKICCVFIEPIQGCLPDKVSEDYIIFLSNYCKKNNIILVMDEIVTGLRIDASSIQNRLNLYSDISTFGKCFGNGLPLAFIGISEKIYKIILNKKKKIFFGGTYSANSLSTFVANQTLKYILANKNKIFSKIKSTSNIFKDKINYFIKKNNIDAKVYAYESILRIIFSKNLINNRMQRDFLEKKKDKNVLKFKNFLLKKNIFYPKNGIIFFSNTIEKYQLSYLIKNINFGLKKFFKKNNSRELIT
jgi:glutamate-1-semialdehyde 2,1-aminomutase